MIISGIDICFVAHLNSMAEALFFNYIYIYIYIYILEITIAREVLPQKRWET